MKSLKLLAVLGMGLLGPSLPLFSAPFVAIGNNTGVFVNGFTTLAYESNLFKVNETAATATAPAVSATSAWSFNFSPGVEVELALRDGGRLARRHRRRPARLRSIRSSR